MRIKNREARKHLSNVLSLMSYANSVSYGNWATQSSDPNLNGVYGAAQTTLVKMLVELIPDYPDLFFASPGTMDETALRIVARLSEIASSFSIEELDEAIEDVLMLSKVFDG